MRHHPLVPLAVAFLVMAGGTRAAGARPEAVTLLPSGGTTIHFVVDVPPPALTPHPGDASLTEIAMDGYTVVGPATEPGLPERVLTVAVPPTGDVRVRAQAGEPVVREGVLLAPMPLASPGREFDSPPRLRSAYAQAGPRLGARARLLGIGWLRDQRVARIAIQPLDYDAAARRLTAVRQVDVTVEVDGAGAAVGGDIAAAPIESAFDGVLAGALVNPEQGRAWRRAEQDRAAAMPASALKAGRIVHGDTVFAQHQWIKIAIQSDGFYKVQFSQLRNLKLFNGRTNVPLDSLRLFTWPGFPVMPENQYCDLCGYQEVALRFVENPAATNDTLDRNDEYFYFYALGPSGWSSVYDSTYADTLFIDHPYETTNYYYLTIAGDGTGDETPVGGVPQRIGLRSGQVTGSATVPATFPQRVHYERDYEYFPNAPPQLSNRLNLFWEKWFWKSLQNGKTFVIEDPTPDAPGADTTQSFRLRARVWGMGASDPCDYGGVPPALHLLDTQFNGIALPRLEWSQLYATRIIDTVMTGLHTRNSLEFTVPQPAGSCFTRFDQITIAWVELYYRRRFEASGEQLAFESEAGGGQWEYHVTGFTSPTVPRVLDVTDPLAPFEITDVTYQASGTPGISTVVFERTEGRQRRYRILPDSLIAPVPSAQIEDAPVAQVAIKDLGSEEQRAQALIIYYDGFKAAADSLAAWRRTRLPVDVPGPFTVVSIPISALYDQFSGGRTDPAAIRDFLRAAYYNWAVRPQFVTLLGDASYDFKDLRGLAGAGRPGTLIPSYENGFDFGLDRQFASDDWMLNVDNAVQVIPDFFGGRIPAEDASTALGYVKKLLSYERTAPFGVYRNRLMLVADDDVKGDSPDFLLWTHLRQTAELDEFATPPHLDRRYVYLHKYLVGPGSTRPGARSDIFKYVDEGVQIFNFVGHGSAFKISDEGVFLYSDPGSLKNDDKPTVFISASCDVGKFNDPELQGLGERLVLSGTGGAVGAISATEEAFSGENATLNRTVFTRIFQRDTLAGSGRYFVGLSDALLTGKLTGTTNSQKYQLMGDAGARLNLPELWVTFSIWDSAGTTPVTDVRRGQVVTYRGEVRESPRSDAPLAPLEGIADVLIEDSQPREQAPDCRDVPGCLDRPFYYYYAGAMFRGDVSVHGGRFEGKFVAPLEARLGGRARMRGYVQGTPLTGGTIDGAGSVFTSVTAGTSSASDAEGPRIALSFAGGSTSVRKDALLQVDLADPSGILTTAHTPQNGIVVTIDDNTTTRTDITSSFRYAADSYQNGNATFQLPDLAPGSHTIRVSAADNLALGLSAGQHRASAVIAFDVVDTPPLSVARTYLFPNPARSGGSGGGGTFVVDAPGDSINVLLRLYTVTGRLIRTLVAPGGLGQVQLPWDGLDADGDALANGVYFYKVYVYARVEDGKSSARQRAIGEGRVVVVGH